MTTKKYGWWFCDNTHRLKYQDGRKAGVGITHYLKNPNLPVRLCRYGFHASPSIKYAIGYADRLNLYRVEVGGPFALRRRYHHDKFCGRTRTYHGFISHDDLIYLILGLLRPYLEEVLKSKGISSNSAIGKLLKRKRLHKIPTAFVTRAHYEYHRWNSPIKGMWLVSEVIGDYIHILYDMRKNYSPLIQHRIKRLLREPLGIGPKYLGGLSTAQFNKMIEEAVLKHMKLTS